MIKVLAPNMACQVIDWAIQAHGGGGVSRRLRPRARLRAARARCASPTARTKCTATQIAKLELGEQTSIAEALALRRA